MKILYFIILLNGSFTKLIDIMSQIILNDILINEISISLLD